MKKALFNFFVWCSGADPEVLSRCGRSEHIKHAEYGGLVLVPALLGFVSMTYAISTLTDSPYAYIGGGLVWAVIVFIFDRFIVATFRKSGNIWRDIFSIVFLSRIVFAVGIGIIVSHPLVLLVFDDSLEQELATMRIEEEDALRTYYEGKIDTVRARNVGLNAGIEEKVVYRQCLEKLLLYEMSGKDTTLQCGTTSGLTQYGPRSRQIKEDLAHLSEEIVLYRQKTEALLAKNQAEIEQLTAGRDRKLEEMIFSTNYLAREMALSRLEAREGEGGVVYFTKWFLILFFVFVDILPVTFKAITKYGEYDRRLKLEEGYNIHLTAAYEREQEEMVQRALVDKMTDIRLRRIEEEMEGV
jgi:hypothetical protein